MDGDQNRPSGKRKIKYQPKKLTQVTKPSARAEPEHTAPQTDARDENAEELIRQFNTANVGQGRKVKDRTPDIAFGAIVGSSSTDSAPKKSFGVGRAGKNSKGSVSRLKDPASYDMKIDIPSPLTAKRGGSYSDESEKRVKDTKSHSPIRLPWRRPNSGDPEILDREEFGEAGEQTNYDETAVNSAAVLGLQQESKEQKMFFFQLPYHLPITKQSAKGKEKAEGSQGASLKNMSSLKELPPGLIGKMRIYKSGKIDMKLGDTVFDVRHDSARSSPEQVAAINTKEKTCSVLGDLATNPAVVSVNFDPLFTVSE